MKTFVSVIIPTFNRDQSLCDTLDCLFKQTYFDYEIIVVDQSNKIFPVKETFLKKHKDKFKLIKLKKANLPGARNRGVEAARGEVIIFCDDDVLFDKDFIAHHLINYEEKTIDAVGGRVVEKGKKERCVSKVGEVTCWGSVRGGFSSSVRQKVGNLFGCNFSVRKDVFLKLGGFDTGFTGNALREETDFALRLKKQNGTIIFDPKAKLIHLHTFVQSGGCRKSDNRLKWYKDYFHNETYFFLKHFSLIFLPYFYVVRWQFFFRCMFGFGREVSLTSLLIPWQGIYLGVKTFLRKK